jgi:hypothetical protein
MNCQEGETCVVKKPLTAEEELANISLKDVPLKVRREEAKKPLFLERYE